MLTVAAYWWTDPRPNRFNAKYQYTAEDVRLLQRQVSRYLSQSHEFVVLTDQPEVFAGDTHIRAVPLDLTKHIPGTEFVKLMTFHPNGREMIGEKVLQLDLDTVITGGLDRIVSRSADLVVWRNPSRIPYDKPVKPGRPYYNGSVILHRCGTMPEMWARFDAANPPHGVRDTQVWMSNMIGPDAPHWDGKDGIYRLAREDTPGSGVSGRLPENARIVTFPGSEGKPWDAGVMAANPWIAEFRR